MFGVERLVMFERDVSSYFGVAMFLRASIVEDGGVFSPRIGLGGGLVDRMLFSLPKSLPLGVGVPDLVASDLVGLLSGDRFSKSKPGVRGSLSGDLSGDLLRDPKAST